MSEEPVTKKYYVQNKKEVASIKAIPNKELNSTDKLILLELLGFIGKRHFSWPSQQTLAKRLGLSERTVRGSLKRLTEKGIIKKMKRGYRLEVYGIQETRSTAYDLIDLLILKEIEVKDDTGKDQQNDEADNDYLMRKEVAD